MNKKSFTKRLFVCLLISLVAIVVIIGGSLAVYTSQVFQRAVVRNRNADVIRFSSDKLYRVAINTPLQTYYYPMSRGQTTMSFTICNYDQNKNTLVSEKDINCVVSFYIPSDAPEFDYKVVDGTEEYSSDDGKVVLNDVILTGGKRLAKSYTINFSNVDYGKVKIAVVVEPIEENLPLTKNNCLQAILVPVEYATVQGVNLRAEFSDSGRGTPDAFDAYNYSVSISGGEKDVFIDWDPAKLDIDPFFLSKGDVINLENGYKRLNIRMNSDDSTGNYLIQFYNHAGNNVSWESWNELPVNAKLADSE